MQMVIQQCFGSTGSLTVGRCRSNLATQTTKCRLGVPVDKSCFVFNVKITDLSLITLVTCSVGQIG